tara:strand:- start:42612 stop:42773 length:162 start_codon:yes stop_codon:yes gene_type:complete
MKNIFILHGSVGYFDEIFFGILILIFSLFIIYSYLKANRRKKLFSKNNKKTRK